MLQCAILQTTKRVCFARLHLGPRHSHSFESKCESFMMDGSMHCTPSASSATMNLPDSFPSSPREQRSRIQESTLAPPPSTYPVLHPSSFQHGAPAAAAAAASRRIPACVARCSERTPRPQLPTHSRSPARECGICRCSRRHRHAVRFRRRLPAQQLRGWWRWTRALWQRVDAIWFTVRGETVFHLPSTPKVARPSDPQPSATI